MATEQEMVARVAEMRARVVEAEAQVPLAISEAFRSGNLGVMDYYRLKNIQADTSMRMPLVVRMKALMANSKSDSVLISLHNALNS